MLQMLQCIFTCSSTIKILPHFRGAPVQLRLLGLTLELLAELSLSARLWVQK